MDIFSAVGKWLGLHKNGIGWFFIRTLCLADKAVRTRLVTFWMRLYRPTGVMPSLECCEPNLVDTQMFRWAHRHIGGHTQFGEMEPISSK